MSTPTDHTGLPQGGAPPRLEVAETFPRPLRVAVLIKQIPQFENFRLGGDGRLVRSDIPLEMNAYCRRAVTRAVQLAGASGGEAVAFTLGPPAAAEVLREAVSAGVSRGVHLCDPAFAGSDTLATADVLAAALSLEGPFDLVLAGRNTLDSDTGQVGPELAELLGMAFLPAVRELALGDGHLHAWSETDRGFVRLRSSLPAVVAAAERLCPPAKVSEAERKADAPIRLLRAAELGAGPWGREASPTRVGRPREVALPLRRRERVTGSSEAAIERAAEVIHRRLTEGTGAARPHGRVPAGPPGPGPAVAVMLVPGDFPAVAPALLGRAAELAAALGGHVAALVCCPGDRDPVAPGELSALGADRALLLRDVAAPEDASASIAAWALRQRPWAVLGASHGWGRELAGRVAARTRSGLTGDATGLEVDADGRLLAWKPALWGAANVPIRCRSPVQMATVQAGALPVPEPRPPRTIEVERLGPTPAGRVRVIERRDLDRPERLVWSRAVIGVGQGIAPGDYPALEGLRRVLGAEYAASRKVTDRGWMPRSRQIGITGGRIAPDLYLAVALSGKFNHMAAVSAAGTVIGINSDPDAPLFRYTDLGIVGDWQRIVPALAYRLCELLAAGGPASESS